MRFTLRPVKAKPLGSGPGARLTPGSSVRHSPAKPVGNFVHADEDAIRTFATQRQRQAMKESFGKSLSYRPVFDPSLRIRTRQEPVEKSMADVAAWTTKTGKTVSLKAKAAPVKAVLRGEELTHATPKIAPGKHAKATRTARATAGAKRVGGYVLREVGYRPDYAGMASTKLLSIPDLVAQGLSRAA